MSIIIKSMHTNDRSMILANNLYKRIVVLMLAWNDEYCFHPREITHNGSNFRYQYRKLESGLERGELY